MELDPSPSTLLQYVDYLLLCSASQRLSKKHVIQLLNFLEEYQVSPKKSQISQPKVTYLGLPISPPKRPITADLMALITSLQPPTTKQEILSFLGLAGYFRIWIPNFSILAYLIYQAIKEALEEFLNPSLNLTPFFNNYSRPSSLPWLPLC